MDENKKRDFGVRGESCADSDRVYRGIGSFMYSWRGVLGNNVIQVSHLWRWIACEFPEFIRGSSTTSSMVALGSPVMAETALPTAGGLGCLGLRQSGAATSMERTQ